MDPNNTMAGTPGEQNNDAMPGGAGLGGAPEAAVSETVVNETVMDGTTPAEMVGSAPSEAAVEMQAAMVADQIANPVEPPKENIMVEGNAVKKKSGKGMMIAVALLALVALGGIGFGVWAMMDGNSQTKTLNDQISSLKKTNNELMEQLSEANANANANDGEDTIINIDTNSDVNPEDYIYVGEWGMKIKIPDGLDKVSYIFRQYNDNTGLAISGVKGQSDTLPYFADLEKNSQGMISVVRVPKGTEMRPYSPPKFILSDDEYDYYYYPPQGLSNGASDENADLANWDTESMNMIVDMLKDAGNWSAI